jgi:hypothetical protein
MGLQAALALNEASDATRIAEAARIVQEAALVTAEVVKITRVAKEEESVRVRVGGAGTRSA